MSFNRSIGEYFCTVYDNYLEGQRDDPEGIGIRVANAATGDVVLYPGKSWTWIERLTDLRLLDWLGKMATNNSLIFRQLFSDSSAFDAETIVLYT